MDEHWKDRAFGDLPIGAKFFFMGTEYIKIGSFGACLADDEREFSWEDEVEIKIIG